MSSVVTTVAAFGEPIDFRPKDFDCRAFSGRESVWSWGFPTRTALTARTNLTAAKTRSVPASPVTKTDPDLYLCCLLLI